MRSSRRCRLGGVEVRVSVSRRRSSGMMSSWSSRSRGCRSYRGSRSRCGVVSISCSRSSRGGICRAR